MTVVEGYVEWINEICVGEPCQHLAAVGREVCLIVHSGNILLYSFIIQSVQFND
jgi:hypothetical protein